MPLLYWQPRLGVMDPIRWQEAGLSLSSYTPEVTDLRKAVQEYSSTRASEPPSLRVYATVISRAEGVSAQVLDLPLFPRKERVLDEPQQIGSLLQLFDVLGEYLEECDRCTLDDDFCAPVIGSTIEDFKDWAVQKQSSPLKAVIEALCIRSADRNNIKSNEKKLVLVSVAASLIQKIFRPDHGATRLQLLMATFLDIHKAHREVSNVLKFLGIGTSVKAVERHNNKFSAELRLDQPRIKVDHMSMLIHIYDNLGFKYKKNLRHTYLQFVYSVFVEVPYEVLEFLGIYNKDGDAASLSRERLKWEDVYTESFGIPQVDEYKTNANFNFGAMDTALDFFAGNRDWIESLLKKVEKNEYVGGAGGGGDDGGDGSGDDEVDEGRGDFSFSIREINRVGSDPVRITPLNKNKITSCSILTSTVTVVCSRCRRIHCSHRIT